MQTQLFEWNIKRMRNFWIGSFLQLPSSIVHVR
jgi:hypothetical protein